MAEDPPTDTADSLAQLEIAGTANWHSFGTVTALPQMNYGRIRPKPFEHGTIPARCWDGALKHITAGRVTQYADQKSPER